MSLEVFDSQDHTGSEAFRKDLRLWYTYEESTQPSATNPELRGEMEYQRSSAENVVWAIPCPAWFGIIHFVSNSLTTVLYFS